MERLRRTRWRFYKRKYARKYNPFYRADIDRRPRMNPKGLTRLELAAINRIGTDYLREDLPEANRIRLDVGYLTGLLLRIN